MVIFRYESGICPIETKLSYAGSPGGVNKTQIRKLKKFTFFFKSFIIVIILILKNGQPLSSSSLTQPKCVLETNVTFFSSALTGREMSPV